VKIHECLQQSDTWWDLKRGVPTASNFDKILTPTTLKPSASQMDFICQLIAERLLVTPQHFVSDRGMSRPMINGVLTEPEARAFYTVATGNEVRQVGFVTTEDGRFGFSPDGLIGEEGGLELKCPMPHTHVRYLLEETLPSEYIGQVHGPLALALLDKSMPFRWWDFVSYFPGLPEFRIHVEPNAYTARLAEELEAFYEKYRTYAGKFEIRI